MLLFVFFLVSSISCIVLGSTQASLLSEESATLDPFYAKDMFRIPNSEGPCKKKKGKDKGHDVKGCSEHPSSQGPSTSSYPTISNDPTILRPPSSRPQGIGTPKPTVNREFTSKTPSISPSGTDRPSYTPSRQNLNSTTFPQNSNLESFCNDRLSNRVSLNNVATMRCRELNRISTEMRESLCYGDLSQIVDAIEQCPDVCEGKCLCERQRSELDKRFELITDQYNLIQDVNFDADTNASRKCRYISTIQKNSKKAICSYDEIQNLCPVSSLSSRPVSFFSL